MLHRSLRALTAAPSPVVATVLVVACAGACGGEGAKVPSGTGDGVAVVPTKAAALQVEARRAGARPFPFAIVTGRVGDQATKLIVDTGAPVHAIDRSLAAAANGKLSVDGWGDVPAHTGEIVDLSPAMKEHGIGGILSPQLLVEKGAAVELDFVNRQMRLRPKSMAWSEVHDIGAALTTQGKPCDAASGGATGQLLPIDAAVEGAPMKLAVDTGIGRTLLLEGSGGGQKAATHAVLGRTLHHGARLELATPIHGGVPISSGSWSTTTDMGMMPGEKHATCGHEGRLGMDVLQYCAIAIAEGEFSLACRSPGL